MSEVFKLQGTPLEANVGVFARQADGSVWLTCGDSVVLATVVASKASGDSLGFFPLSVECRERLSSVGKIPGGYIKREGRLSDSEILLSRIVDRSVRPLFPDFYLSEVQMMVTLLSFDGQFPMEVLSILSASIALVISGLPFKGPVGAVVCARANAQSEWKINPSEDFLNLASDRVLVVGTSVGVCMVEAECDFVENQELVNLVENQAFQEIKKQIDWQNDIKSSLGVAEHSNQTWLENEKSAKFWMSRFDSLIPASLEEYVFAESKSELSVKLDALAASVLDSLEKEIEDKQDSKVKVRMYLDSYLKKLLPKVLVENNKRFDHRSFDQIRNIDCLVDILPRSHGSAVFTRGQTQALSSLTLGASGDAQKIETLLHGVQDKHFMLHYNFPPFATGEVKPLRGVGRREIGHGYLAEKSFKYVLPDSKAFPYTIRSLVDVLESNGSSSMATVCATTLALMDAGVPIKRVIAGIAMGLIRGKNGQNVVLSDISGTEDAYGVMDFKVVGDERGVVAIQIDVKSDEGLSAEIFRDALNQSSRGLAHILGKMRDVLPTSRTQLKESAPRCFTLKIPQGKTGALIGPGGKNIKQITAETNTQIDIADDGTVSIFALDAVSAKRADGWIRVLVGDVKNGSFYQGKVSKIAEFGIFVSIVPGKDGLVHISSIDRSKRDRLEELYKTGDPIDVVVVSVDYEGKIKLVAPELEGGESMFD